MQVLGWWELPEEDQPPGDIWGCNEELKDWFEAVKARRKEKYGGGSAGADQDEVVPLMDNEYAKEVRRQLSGG